MSQRESSACGLSVPIRPLSSLLSMTLTPRPLVRAPYLELIQPHSKNFQSDLSMESLYFLSSFLPQSKSTNFRRLQQKFTFQQTILQSVKVESGFLLDVLSKFLCFCTKELFKSLALSQTIEMYNTNLVRKSPLKSNISNSK